MSANTSDCTLNGQIRKITPGETFEAVLSYADYKASDGWACSVNFCGNGFVSSVACTTNGDGNSFDLAVPASTTSTWKWGPASAQAILSKSTTNIKVAEMICFTVMPDPTKKTDEMTALEAIDAVIANRATSDQLTTALEGGIQLQYRSISDLQKLRSYYKRIVNMQIKMIGGKGGTYSIQHIYPENRTIGSPWYGGYPPPVRR